MPNASLLRYWPPSSACSQTKPWHAYLSLHCMIGRIAFSQPSMMVCILQAALQESMSTTQSTWLPQRWTDGAGMPEAYGKCLPVAVCSHELDGGLRCSPVHMHHDDNAHNCCSPDHWLEGADVSTVCHQSAACRLALINSLAADG